MKQVIKFTVPLAPVGQQRARSRAVRTKSGRAFAMTYKAKDQREAEDKFRSFLIQFMPPVPIAGAVLLGIKAFLPIPASKPKKFKIEAEAGLIRPTKKPDIDNIIKHAKDCMNEIFWKDDKQVVGYLPDTGKYYSDRPRWEITVQEI